MSQYLSKSLDEMIKDNKKYLCIIIKNGFSCWMEGNTSVEILDLYFRDKEGNRRGRKQKERERIIEE